MPREQDDPDWRRLWADYGPRLLLFARQQTPALGDAEDLVQEAFVRYWKARQTDAALTPALMFTLVKRAAIDLARRDESRRTRETEVWSLAEVEPLFDTPAEDRERKELLATALQALPAAQREVLVLKTWGGLTFDEIGETLGVSPHTAASRYRYGLQQLRGSLRPVLP
jgi:RNA polymerase sigma-70 factor (ECF subfamily)